MAETYTKAKVRQNTAEMLGVVSVGQSVANPESAKIDESWDKVYYELLDGELATWPVAGPVPVKAAPHIIALMAMDLTEVFPVSDKRYGRIVAKNNIAKRELRKLSQPKHESLDDQTDF